MINKGRITRVISIFSVIIFVLIIRLAHIQLFSTQNFSKYNINLIEESIKQRTQTFILQSGRGYFTDRNGEPLQFEYHPSLILFPFLKNLDWPVDKVSSIISMPTEELLDQVEQNKGPFLLTKDQKPISLTDEQMKQINALKVEGVFAQNIEKKVKNIAPHLLGVTGENASEAIRRYQKQIESGLLSVHDEIGVSGLQRSLDPFLLSRGKSFLAYYVDNLGNPMFGYDVKYVAPGESSSPTKVVTTIDRDIQLYATKTLEQMGISFGGLVLIDIETNDLLALVNTPTYELTDPFGFGAKNQMVTAHAPGSIFKTVIAAAAIEYDLVNSYETFNCNRNMYDDGEDERKLGLLNFKDSFAQSCNYTYTNLAQKLIQKDELVIEKFATKLGLNERIGWIGDVYRQEKVKHFPEEESGLIKIREEDMTDRKLLAQTAIGQNNVQVTPLAVANMLATIARGGEKKQVRAVSKIVYENDANIYQFPIQKIKGSDRISKYTALKLQELLQSVVSSDKGTGQALANSPYTIAGKSGTAQKGENNKSMNHWFAGYFPVERPKYSLAIVDLDHKKGSNATIKAYQQMVQFLAEFDRAQE